MSIGHESGPALIKVSRFVSRHQGLILKILTDISPVNLLVSPNVEVKDNVILSIGIVHKMFRIFYFLGVKLEVIDKVQNLVTIITGNEADIKYAQEQIENINRNFLSGIQDFRLIFTAILKYVKRPDNDYCGDFKKPKLSICINYVHTSIDILNHHMQNFRRISIKLEKGISTTLLGNTDKTALQKDTKLVLTDILEKLVSFEKNTAIKYKMLNEYIQMILHKIKVLIA
ncbi:hypothetical protein RhiirA5_362609 [Rhizophagus irregularis]|uniref:Uncharacterized protein n=1 Tax=Rhizophagus irregularis TaxID=588596 RepID=A0A2N0PBL7_9GLOM|nr:hypothetical protein RhiirA5_362609 [Rhizophagus irregularis]